MTPSRSGWWLWGLAAAAGLSAQAPVRQTSAGEYTRGRSIRLRISETYTDSVRYRLEGDELVWDRAFGRPANAVVLPPGWLLSHSTVPGTVSLTSDGRVRLDFVNPRLDEIQVLIVARRRPVP